MDGMFKKSHHHESNFELQITALIDTLVIILIFLLKSISMESLEEGNAKQLATPMVQNGYSTGTGHRLVISRESISWNSTEILKVKDVMGRDDSNARGEWSKLAGAIQSTEEKDKSEKSENIGKLFVQADKAIPFSLVQAALKVAKEYGYKDIKFIGAKYN